VNSRCSSIFTRVILFRGKDRRYRCYLSRDKMSRCYFTKRRDRSGARRKVQSSGMKRAICIWDSKHYAPKLSFTSPVKNMSIIILSLFLSFCSHPELCHFTGIPAPVSGQQLVSGTRSGIRESDQLARLRSRRHRRLGRPNNSFNRFPRQINSTS